MIAENIIKKMTIIILSSLIFIGVVIIFCHSVKESSIRTEQILAKKYEEGYLDACKDFYKGKLKYDLIENEDGTKTWQKIQ